MQCKGDMAAGRLDWLVGLATGWWQGNWGWLVGLAAWGMVWVPGGLLGPSEGPFRYRLPHLRLEPSKT